MRVLTVPAIAICAFLVATLAACQTTSATPPPGPVDNLWQKANEVKPGEPWVVGLGDSYISGESGRWASNGVDNAEFYDYGGWLVGTVDQVYGDGPDGHETIPFCHRSATAPMFVGQGYNIKNLACSGATAASAVGRFGRLKPGIDFIDEMTQYGQVTGQALQLERFAKDHEVKAVVLSIIGNDANFSDIIANCVTAFLTPGSSSPCSTSDAVGAVVNNVNRVELTQRVAAAVQNINTAMSNAGRQPDQWRLIYNMYPSPLPPASQMALRGGYDRQFVGGCGMLDEDIDWANTTLMPWLYSLIVDGVKQAKVANPDLAPVTLVDNSQTLDGHRLCEQGVARPPASTGLPPNDFGDQVEWVRNISLEVAEFYPQSPAAIEPMHPNYFGQRALATCVRLAIEFSGTPASLKCVPNGPVKFDGQVPPLMTNYSVLETETKVAARAP